MPNILKLAALSTALLISFTSHARTLLNVSYDPTREFYSEYNQAFNQYWQAQGNAPITIQQSHGGSGKQARAVIDGLRADVVTLALAGEFEIIVPSLSILAEPPVAVVDRNVDRKGSRELAEAYLSYLYSEQAQRIAARHFYRPRNPQVAAEFSQQFPQLKLVTIEDEFSGWQQAQQKFFAEDALFDRIYQD